MIGNKKFEKIVFVKQMFISNLNTIPEKWKICRCGITSEGNFVASTSDTNMRITREVLDTFLSEHKEAYDYVDTDYYIHTYKNEAGYKDFIFWHNNFLEKVKKVAHELSFIEIDILMSKNRFADDKPEDVFNDTFLRVFETKLLFALMYETDRWDMTVKQVLKKEISNYEEFQRDYSPYKFYIEGRDVTKHSLQNISHTIIERFKEEMKFFGKEFQDIQDLTLKQLMHTYLEEPEIKADKFRDEILKKFGFEPITAGKAYKIHTKSHFRINQFEVKDIKNSEEVIGWSKIDGNDIIFIDHNGQVYINNKFICIVPTKSRPLPKGDEIATKVVAVATNYRNNISTLDEHRDTLEKVFEGSK